MKRRGLALGVGLLALLIAVQAGAYAITVELNGTPLPAAPPAVERQGRVLLPLRVVFEALGAQVNWLAATQTVTAQRGDRTVQMTINSPTAFINGQSVALDVPPQLIAGSTYVPVRFPAEALGADVRWDQPTQTVLITQEGAPVPPPAPAPQPLPQPLPPPQPMPQPQGGRVSGTIAQILSTRVAVTVEGELRVFTITPDTIVTLANEQIGVNNLLAGDRVTVQYDAAQNATRIRANYETAEGTVGAKTVRDILLDSQPQPFTIEPRVFVFRASGEPITYADVQVGDHVVLRLTPGTRNAYAITVIGTAEVGTPPPQPLPPPAAEVTVEPQGPLTPGQSLLVTVQGPPGAQVSVDAGSLFTGVPAPEVESGTYAVELIIPAVTARQSLRVRAHLRTPDGHTLDAAAPRPVVVEPGG